jgi:hypothetical protein
MKSIGFIDYYLDEWHANQYPVWIEKGTGGRMKVTSAYGKVDAKQGLSNAEWCKKHGVELLPTIEEVVERSDYLVVLSPDHPEYHEELSRLPLLSGKPTYVDKTFAPDRDSAARMLELAERSGTPMFSSSALRFATEYSAAPKDGIETIVSIGPGRFENYSIHQIEPIVSLMGSAAVRVMWVGTAHSPALLIGFADGRQATIHHFSGGCPFGMSVGYTSGSSIQIKVESDFFERFIHSVTSFFESGESPVDPQETLAIITIIENAFIAARTPYQWIELPGRA